MNYKIIFTLIFIHLSFSILWSGAWVKPQGNYFLKLAANYMSTNQEFDYKGEKISYLGNDLVFEDTQFRDINIYLYYEYGITNNITIWGDQDISKFLPSITYNFKEGIGIL